MMSVDAHANSCAAQRAPPSHTSPRSTAPPIGFSATIFVSIAGMSISVSIVGIRGAASSDTNGTPISSDDRPNLGGIFTPAPHGDEDGGMHENECRGN